MTSLFAIIIVGTVVSGAFSAGALWLIARALGAANVSFYRALAVVLIASATGILIGAGGLYFADSIGSESAGYVSLAVLCVLFIQIIFVCRLIQVYLGLSPGRAVLVWVLHSVVNAATAVPIIFLLKSYVMNAYIPPTNSMAPTVTGWHQEDVCPLCQGRLIVPGIPPDDPFRDRMNDRGDEVCICADCLGVSNIKTTKSPMLSPSRFLVSRLLTPQRWDIIVFRSPLEPKQKRFYRMVGMSGETVHIKEEAIWVNGAKLEPPSELKGIKYTATIGGFNENLGTEANPFRLGPNECCVLGDFPQRSSDSRDWGPVPMENIEGVVCSIYWPVRQWRILR